MNSLRFRFAVGALVLFGCSASDAPKTAPVSGTVTMQGKPLAGAGVTFFPTGKGPMATGNTNENGEFTLMTNRPGDGAPVGGHRVAIGNAEEGRRKSGPNIPERYGKPDSSGLTAEVKAGQKNVFAFDLKP
jgi:hypothetical protein